jgi:hypothetical protein
MACQFRTAHLLGQYRSLKFAEGAEIVLASVRFEIQGMAYMAGAGPVVGGRRFPEGTCGTS